jgi:type I restriction enzyme S subunit
LEDQRSIAAWLDRLYELNATINRELGQVKELLKRAETGFTESVLQSSLLEDPADGHERVHYSAAEHELPGDSTPSQEDLILPSLPEHVVPIRPLKDLARSIRYGLSRRGEHVKFDGSVPIIRMGNIRDGEIELYNLQYVQENAETDRFLLDDGDLLFNRTNSPELVGKTAVFRAGGRAVFASYLIRVKLNTDLVVPEFVALWLNSSWGRRWAEAVKSDGVSQSNINASKLGDVSVPLPTLHLQRRCVEAIRTSRSRIRRLTVELEAVRTATTRAVSEALDSTMHLSALWSAAELPSAPLDGREQGEAVAEDVIPVIRGSSGPTESRRDLVEVVTASGGSCTPTSLWQAAGYTSDIDAFYRELRACVEARTLIEHHISRTERRIEVANEN